MPPPALLLLFLAVCLAAGATVLLLSLGGPGVMAVGLPLFAAAALLVRVLRK